MATSYSFKITNLKKQLNESGYIKQIESKELKVLEINNQAIIIHTETLSEMKRCLQKYWAIWYNSPFRDATDKEIQIYENQLRLNKEIQKEVGTSNEVLNELISLFVKKIYLQPVYYYNAIKQHPDSLPHKEKIYKRYDYINIYSNLAYDKYIGDSKGIYKEIISLLSKGNKKEVLQDLKTITYFTENLIDDVPYYLHPSPIMIQFISSIFELKMYYDYEIENKGLPKMNNYFNRIDKNDFQINYVHFEKDAEISMLYNGTDKSKCSIAEFTAKDHKKIRTIEEIEGFAVYLSYIDYVENVISSWNNTSLEISSLSQIETFEKYIELLNKKRKSVKTINRLNDPDFLVITYGNEVENLEMFKKYTEYFIHIDNLNKFLDYCNGFIDWLKHKQLDETIPPRPIKEKPKTENDLVFSTIEDWLYPFKDEKILTDVNYNNLVSALKQYFDNGNFPMDNKQIQVKMVNKKRFGWALKEIFRTCKTDNETLPIEYLLFAKQNISIFKNTSFDENNHLNSNLYKYFTTKTEYSKVSTKTTKTTF